MNYFDALKETMEFLATKNDTIFLGQATACAGTFMSQTLRDVPIEKRIEMPVCESFQMQMSIGLALSGYFPISIYPRQNFLLLATADMVNTLDKIPHISQRKILPKMIIRVASGTTKPIFPGVQHVGNYAESFSKMFNNIEVMELEEPEEIKEIYEYAYERKDNKCTLIIEHGDYYQDK